MRAEQIARVVHEANRALQIEQADLPPAQRIKDHLFVAIVRTLSEETE